jgi:hypothetical protein
MVAMVPVASTPTATSPINAPSSSMAIWTHAAGWGPSIPLISPMRRFASATSYGAVQL